jgi:hypothetical protein
MEVGVTLSLVFEVHSSINFCSHPLKDNDSP